VAGSDIPYAELEAVLLDAGNTLVSMDLEWIRRELFRLGVRAKLEALEQAEAAARPAVSSAVAAGGSTEAGDHFALYLEALLRPLTLELDPAARAPLARRLADVLRAPGEALRLWTRVLPGVREALAALRALDLRLVVVSNSDGSCREQLERAGLTRHLDAVVDSQRVGVEKPDPAIFVHALAAARCAPERALHVGDIYAADVAGARAAGIHAALLDPYGDWEGADCARFTDLAELSESLCAARSGRRPRPR
jgi:putative hydrolase of the HAD superfamily